MKFDAAELLKQHLPRIEPYYNSFTFGYKVYCSCGWSLRGGGIVEVGAKWAEHASQPVNQRFQDKVNEWQDHLKRIHNVLCDYGQWKPEDSEE